MWWLNYILLNNQWITEKIKEDIKQKYLETDENKKMMTPNPQEAVKVVPKELIPRQMHFRKQERPQRNSVTSHLSNQRKAN